MPQQIDSNAIKNEKNMENFTISKVLGFGSYAVVKLATHNPS